MSAWGTKVWQDDAADDVLITFEDLLEAGATPREAVRLIILNPPMDGEMSRRTYPDSRLGCLDSEI